jgi:hypothetical protein
MKFFKFLLSILAIFADYVPQAPPLPPIPPLVRMQQFLTKRDIQSKPVRFLPRGISDGVLPDVITSITETERQSCKILLFYFLFRLKI